MSVLLSLVIFVGSECIPAPPINPRFNTTLVTHKPKPITGPTAACDCENCECVDCHCGYPQRIQTVTRCEQCPIAATKPKAVPAYQPEYRVDWGGCPSGNCPRVKKGLFGKWK